MPQPVTFNRAVLVRPSRAGEPWEDWEDAKINDDWRAGCELYVIALRARRTAEEVKERLSIIRPTGYPDKQPRLRSARW